MCSVSSSIRRVASRSGPRRARVGRRAPVLPDDLLFASFVRLIGKASRRACTSASRRYCASVSRLQPGSQPGHPATAQAGLEILAEGGTAADAAVAAALATCVAETVMTGLMGGGHALWWDAAPGRGATPRLLRRRARASAPTPRAAAEQCRSPSGAARSLRGRDRLVRRPGRPCRARRALATPRPASRGRGSCAPALALARYGVAMPPAHARVPRDARARDDDARGGADLRPGRTAARAGDLLGSRGSRGRSSSWPTRARAPSTRARSPALLALMAERGGLVTATTSPPTGRAGGSRSRCVRRATRAHARQASRRSPRRSRALPRFGGSPEPARALALAGALAARRHRTGIRRA